jgi:hypothetical protein
VTVTLDELVFVEATWLVATTVQAAALGGAVYTPAAVIVPQEGSTILHVTAVFVVFVTVAAKVSVPPATTVAVAGATAIATGAGAAVTVTLDELVFVESATLVATTVQAAALGGAVYTPAAVIVPQEGSTILHVTAVFVVFVTVAAKVSVPPAATVAVAGATAIATGAVTITVLWCRELGFERLVARTWKVPDVCGAV